MYIIFGIKKFCAKRTGYGKDYCNACEQEAVVERWRSFAWIHFFWIPLIPFGYRYEWKYRLCFQNPMGRYKSNILAKGLITLLSFALVFIIFQPDSLKYMTHEWPIKIAAITVGLACLIWLLSHKNQPTKNELRKNIPPIRKDKCLYCDSPLGFGLINYCEKCDLKIYDEIK